MSGQRSFSDEFLGVLCRCATGCSRKALKMDRISFTDQQLKKVRCPLRRQTRTISSDLKDEGVI